MDSLTQKKNYDITQEENENNIFYNEDFQYNDASENVIHFNISGSYSSIPTDEDINNKIKSLNKKQREIFDVVNK